MTWKSTVTYWLLAALFGSYYLVVEKRPEPRTEMQLARERVLNVYSDDIAGLTLKRDGKEIRCEVKDKRWVMVKPEGAKVPPDLVAALVENLTDKQEAEEINATPKPEDLVAFGFSDKSTVIDLDTKEGTKLSITLGARNPPQTAIYAKTSVTPRVLLVGVNVQYYTELLYEAGLAKPPPKTP
jgi:hypothetical protein